MRAQRFLPVLLALTTLGLAACGSTDAPAQAVEDYLGALVAEDFDRVVNLSCAEFEAEAIAEVDSLEAVSARLENAGCQSAGEDGDYTLVTCSGSIVMTYNGEDRPIDLGRRTYRTIQDGGVWLMCGYQE